MIELISIPRIKILFLRTNAAIECVNLVIKEMKPNYYDSIVIFLSELL